LTGVALVVHRATNHIGGNCIEIVAGSGARLILDVGRPLDALPNAIGLLPSTLDLMAPADVLISHSHQDHWGLLSEVPSAWVIHCGKATAKLIAITAEISQRQSDHTFSAWTSGASFRVGPFLVTPYLTDHSAFDAYMLLIEVEGRKLLYSGDFRRHGRKGGLVDRLMASPPYKVDVLLMEGTNLGSNKSTISEDDLENDFVRLFEQTSGRVFAAWSAQNIDRTVTIYRAAKRAGRTMVVDLYTADVLETLKDYGQIPAPGWDNLKVLITRSFARLYRMKGRGEFVDRMAKHGIAARALTQSPAQWTCMVRPSLIRDMTSAGVVPSADDAWCWSMWKGYLGDEDGRRVEDWFGVGGARAVHLHTSGHASPADLRRFAAAIDPAVMVPIHGNTWDANADGFPPIRRLKDGEVMEV
jgi:ribonuclease J